MNIIEINELTKSYNGQICLNGLSLTVKAGELVALTGENGSGKTTLLETLAGIRKPDSGSVIIDGQDIFSLSDSALAALRRSTLGVVYQSFGLIQTLSAADNILLPLQLSHVPKKEAAQRVQELAVRLGIESTLKKYPHELSGGQQQRVAIARALVYEPKILLLDEPTASLDKESVARLDMLLDELSKKGVTILMITHRASFRNCTRTLTIKDGVIV